MTGGEFGEIPLGEDWHIFRPFPERNRADRHHIQPVEEVFSETALVHLDSQITVCGCQHADVNWHFIVAADRHDNPLLQHAEEFGLEFQFHLPDLVEEDRAGLSGPKAAQRRGGGAGKGALRVAKHVARKKRTSRHGTVDGNERLFRPQAATMDRSGNEFLAGATRTHDEDAGLMGSDQLNRPANLVRPGRNTNNPLRGRVHAFPLYRPLRCQIHTALFCESDGDRRRENGRNQSRAARCGQESNYHSQEYRMNQGCATTRGISSRQTETTFFPSQFS